jgi:hypothetical protein
MATSSRGRVASRSGSSKSRYQSLECPASRYRSGSPAVSDPRWPFERRQHVKAAGAFGQHHAIKLPQHTDHTPLYTPRCFPPCTLCLSLFLVSLFDQLQSFAHTCRSFASSSPQCTTSTEQQLLDVRPFLQSYRLLISSPAPAS